MHWHLGTHLPFECSLLWRILIELVTVRYIALYVPVLAGAAH